MKKMKNNNMFYLIISFIMCIISSTIGVYAGKTYFADQIIYASEYGVDKTLDNALDDLYYASSRFANPRGAIVTMMGNNAPEGYLKCDGKIYNISDYPNLADYFNKEFGKINYFGGNGTTTFAVPDLRGEFLRGTGTNSHENQGDGANVGVHQNGTEHLWFASYSDGSLQTHHINNTAHNVPLNMDYKINLTSDFYRNHEEKNEGSGESSLNKPSHYTSRPTNTSVLYCIKY